MTFILGITLIGMGKMTSKNYAFGLGFLLVFSIMVVSGCSSDADSLPEGDAGLMDVRGGDVVKSEDAAVLDTESLDTSFLDAVSTDTEPTRDVLGDVDADAGVSDADTGPVIPTPYGVKASSFGYDAENATAALVAAINSDEPAIIIDADMGSTWLVDPMSFFNLSDKTIFIEEGVTIQARAGQFDAPSAKLFRFVNCSNIEIFGYGATLRMLRDEEYNANDMPGEWRIAISMHGVSNFRVEGVFITNSGGDALYVDGSDQRGPSRDVFLHHIRVDGARRQGLSVISVDGLSVRDFDCRDVKGRYPMAGIDFEPDRPEDVLKNIVLEDIRLEQNARTGILISLQHLTKQSEPVDIQVRNLYLKDNWIQEEHYENVQRGELIVSTAPRGRVSFENVYIDGSQQGFLYNRSDADGFQLTFKNVIARDINTHAESWGPIGYEVRDYGVPVLPMGNTVFENVYLSTHTAPPLMWIRGSGTGTNVLRDLTGEIFYTGEFDPLVRQFDMDGEENYTLTFTPVTSVPSRQDILGW